MKLKKLLKTSRPRFWIYSLGTYVLGVAAVIPMNNYHAWACVPIVLFGIFFTYPANLFTYGVNDIYDYETDLLNPKKIAYESLIYPTERKILWWHIIGICSPFLMYALTQSHTPSTLSLVFFFICAASYSIPPIRAKARPFWDSITSGLHYVSPGIVGYIIGSQITGIVLASSSFILCVTSGILWAAAMHAFSAVPDIQADTDAKVATIATRLGKAKTITLCILLYSLAIMSITPALGILGLCIGGVYIGILVYAYNKNDQQLFAIYKKFPLLNTLVGMILFFYIFLK